MDKQKISKTLGDIIYFARTETEADRCIAAYEGVGRSHGFGEGAVDWESAALSLEMLAGLVRGGEAVLFRDSRSHPEYGARISTVLSDLGSVLFVPIRNEFGYPRGFFYIDQIGRSTFLSEGFFERVKRFITDTVEPQIHVPREALGWSHLNETEWLD